MKTIRQTYSHNNLEMLRDSLFDKVQNGQQIKYSIMVDSIPAVHSTDNIDKFDDYLRYVDKSTKEIMFRIFPNPNNFNCLKYIFEIATTKHEDSKINVQEIVAQQVERERHIMKIESLSEKLSDEKDKVAQLKLEVSEKDIEIEKLQEGIEKLQNKGASSNNTLGHVAGLAFEGFIKRNPNILNSIPGADGLAGALNDQNTTESSEQKTEVQFKEQEDHFLAKLANAFSQTEYNKLFELIDLFANDKASLIKAYELFLNQ